MRILVIGGMHGNEPLGLEVVKLFEEKPAKNVDVVLANEPAIAADCRFVGRDLNRSFPGDSRSNEYESKRAAQLVEQAKAYDVVLDFHNTYCPDNDCGFVGESAGRLLYDVAWAVGLDKIIVADYDCMNKYASNCLSVEISLDSRVNQAEVWYERIALLGRIKGFTAAPQITRYRFVYRMTLEDKQRLALEAQDLRAFQPMPVKLAAAMNLRAPALPIFIGDRFTPYNYGGVLNQID